MCSTIKTNCFFINLDMMILTCAKEIYFGPIITVIVFKLDRN